jgi:hypothetical protein
MVKCSRLSLRVQPRTHLICKDGELASLLSLASFCVGMGQRLLGAINVLLPRIVGVIRPTPQHNSAGSMDRVYLPDFLVRDGKICHKH